jgi:hypothetical protein
MRGARGACVLAALLYPLGAAAFCHDAHCMLPEDTTALLQQSTNLRQRKFDGELGSADEWMQSQIGSDNDEDDEWTSSALRALQGTNEGFPRRAAATLAQTTSDIRAIDQDHQEKSNSMSSENQPAVAQMMSALPVSMTMQVPNVALASQGSAGSVQTFGNQAMRGIATAPGSKAVASSPGSMSSGLEKLTNAIASKQAANRIAQKAANNVLENADDIVRKAADKVIQKAELMDLHQQQKDAAPQKESTAEAMNGALDRLDKMLHKAAAEDGERKLDKILDKLAGKEEPKIQEVPPKQMSSTVADDAGLTSFYDLLGKHKESPAEESQSDIENWLKKKDLQGFEELMHILADSKKDDPKSASDKVKKSLNKEVLDPSILASATEVESTASKDSGFDELLHDLAAGAQDAVKSDAAAKSSQKLPPPSKSEAAQEDTSDIAKIFRSLISPDPKPQASSAMLSESSSQKLNELLSSVGNAGATMPTRSTERSEKMSKLLNALDQFLQSNGIGHIAFS